MSRSQAIYEKVFGNIIQQMEQGVVPWERPWTGGASQMPYNASTGRRYTGGNVLALWAAGLGYSSSGWVTFAQALDAGCVVTKGQKGVPVYFFGTTEPRKKDDNAETKSVPVFFAKQFTVFHVEQLSDVEPGAVAALRARHERPETRTEYERLEDAEALVAQTGATIGHGGDRACYVVSRDVIQMPDLATFTTRDAYYGTLFHELGHWTGHASRLNRITPAMFGSPDYAYEELVAELTAAFVCGTLGLDMVSQAASYLAGWVKACKKHPELLARAASQAQKAADLLTGVSAAPVSEEMAA
jgi:antirestriction protein ArdC